MAAADDTLNAINAALDSATAEREVCGGPTLETVINLLEQAQTAQEQHEHTEDHING